jgi:4-amino-4-deoxy-L-arabinose transferase-like glycosyltransferase
MSHVRWPRARGASWLLELGALVFCALLVWATAIGSNLNHNEQMYVAAARLWWEFDLYSDYAYLQAPLLPIVNAGLFALTGNEHLLLLARLHVAFWSILAVMAVYEIGRRLSGNRLVAVAAAGVFGSHRLFLSNVAESSNYIMPLGLTTLSLLACILATDESFSPRARAAWSAISGLTIGLAVSCKSFYALVALGVFATTVAVSDRRLVLHWIGGGLIGALPLVYYALRDPSAFYFGNLDYHVANTEYRRVTDSHMPMKLSQRLRFFRRLWRNPLITAVTLYSVVALIALWRLDVPRTKRRLFIGACVITFLSCIAALLPSPAYLQYFAMPFACLIITAVVAASLYSTKWRVAFVAVCVLGIAFAPATRRMNKLLRKSSAPARVEREARNLDRRLDCSEAMYVATLSPILPLEAGCSIYPELATGPFAFRVADHRTPAMQEDLNVVGPSRLQAFLNEKKPHAILVGFEPRHDGVFETYAKQQGYVEVNQRFMSRGRLWIAPETSLP